MTFAKANGTKVSKTTIPTTPVTTEAMVKVTENIYQAITFPHSRFEGGSRLIFAAGQVVKQSAIDALFAPSTFESVTPATGGIAGGTDVIIKGTNFGGATAVTFGGVAATLVKVVDEQTITCRTPATTAGAKAIVITDDSGTVTANNAFTYS